MSILNIVVMVLLFVALSPGVLFYIPSGFSRKVAALVHGLVFAFIWYLLLEFTQLEGFLEGACDKKCSKYEKAKCWNPKTGCKCCSWV